jgi:3-hydroxy acid dehydrogenase / malonic semialdehyde reductase
MKTILITGASSGFGKATAELLAEQGHRLILVARRSDRLEQLRASLPVAVHTATVDVADKAQVQQFFDSLPDEFRSIDVLVNNAGRALGMAPAQDTDLEDWERMVDTNIKGLLYITRPTLDIMKARGDGLIINIGSVAAHLPYRGGNVYGATKAFVRQFSRNLRTDVFGTSIKVTNIEPGMAETEFSEVRFHGDTDKAKTVYEGTRSLKAEDIANTIAWVINQPERVNIDNVEIMPIDQTYGGAAIHRKSEQT